VNEDLSFDEKYDRGIKVRNIKISMDFFIFLYSNLGMLAIYFIYSLELEPLRVSL
jgi:hypothetical protein